MTTQMPMEEIAIRTEGLWKQYKVGALRKSSDRLTERIMDSLAQPIRRVRSLARGDAHAAADLTENFWALEDVSFEVRRGEVVGLIGQNGAGKSTLLKILSRITSLTRGYVEIHGRIGSLLEVGTGFHRDLTGRENIFLNGAILGMRRLEVARQFDEIVAFSGVEKFLDTPVKRFSSGMYLRLAFAVAAHLEPEILLVDEVLAVGDAEFQKKCLGRMSEVARQGRTVVFVSHNLGAVQALCTRALLIRRGRIAADSAAPAVVATYLRDLEQRPAPDLLGRADRGGKGAVRIARIEVHGGRGAPGGALTSGGPASFVIHMNAPCNRATCSFTIYDQLGQPITYFDSADHGREDEPAYAGRTSFLCEIDQLLLRPGRYRVNAGISSDGEIQDHIEGACFIDIEESELRGRPISRAGRHGSVFMQHRWKVPPGSSRVGDA